MTFLIFFVLKGSLRIVVVEMPKDKQNILFQSYAFLSWYSRLCLNSLFRQKRSVMEAPLLAASHLENPGIATSAIIGTLFEGRIFPVGIRTYSFLMGE